MPRRDPRLPPEVEEFFIARAAALGEMGGRLGGAIGGGRAGARGAARGGARGGARGAGRLKTVVAERSETRPGTPDELRERIVTAFPDHGTLATPRQAELWRITIPYGFMDLGDIVVDLTLSPVPDSAPATTTVHLLAYTKEGLLRRGTAEKMAHRVLAGLDAPG